MRKEEDELLAALVQATYRAPSLLALLLAPCCCCALLPAGEQRVQERAETIGDVAALLQSERLRRRGGHSVVPHVELEGT